MKIFEIHSHYHHIQGWDVDCKDVPKKDVAKCGSSWKCPSESKKSSSIKTKLSGVGKARLHFGNCNKDKKGMVKVLLDSQEIATAKKMKRNEVIEFDFHHDSTLEIVGMEKGAIQFNDFEIFTFCNKCRCADIGCLRGGLNE